MVKKNAQKKYADPPPPYSDFDGINRVTVAHQYAPDEFRQPDPLQQGKHLSYCTSLFNKCKWICGEWPQSNALNDHFNYFFQVNTVIHVSNPPVGPNPTVMVCPSCHETIQTRLSYEPGSRTHLACLILCLIQ